MVYYIWPDVIRGGGGGGERDGRQHPFPTFWNTFRGPNCYLQAILEPFWKLNVEGQNVGLRAVAVVTKTLWGDG